MWLVRQRKRLASHLMEPRRPGDESPRLLLVRLPLPAASIVLMHEIAMVGWVVVAHAVA
jgi:hypothetical protein